MANWTGILEEAEDKIAAILGAHVEGIAKVDDLPDIMAEQESLMYTADLHGGGTAIEVESQNFDTKGSEVGSAREKQIACTIQGIATTKRLARRFVEGIWNALPQEPDARPIFRIYAETEPDMTRGSYPMAKNAGADRQVWLVTCTLAVMLYKGGN